ncbi:helicase-related protein [Glutamicibacter uratoxydans]|uniref:helicase-related protein n=1 Tax=Glutamicibacter uratoxydans TaxID=43667 RepID=UPI003D70133A
MHSVLDVGGFGVPVAGGEDEVSAEDVTALDVAAEKVAVVEATISDAVPARVRQGPVPPRYVGEPGLGAPRNERERVRANLDALRLLTVLEEEYRWPSMGEQAVLAQYASWGGASKVFEEWRGDWAAEHDELRFLVDEPTYRELAASTLNAHFTPDDLAASMWAALTHAGFTDGQVLEPGSGKGTFIKHAPAGADMVGVEIDSVTARISSFLAPDAQIHRESFGTYQRSKQSFHAVIGNVPFGDFKVRDPKHNPGRHSIHNHFILKSLQLTAPGGYAAVVTSSYTMDSRRGTARAEMQRHGDLLGALRLPNGAFKSTVGTDVLTDILIFRARAKDQQPANREPTSSIAWLTLGELDVGEHTVEVNQYFLDNPEHVLGRWATASTPYGGRTAAVTADDLSLLGADVQRAMVQIVDQARAEGLGYEPILGVEAPVFDPGLHQETVLTHTVGHVRYEGNGFEQYEPDGSWAPVRVAKKNVPESIKLLELRDRVSTLLDMQRTHQDPDRIAEYRDTVAARYTEYVHEYGALNRTEDVFRTPTSRQIAAKIQDATTQWRQTLPTDGDIAPVDVPVPEELLEVWTEEFSARELVRSEQKHLKFLAGDSILGLLTAAETYSAQTGEAAPGAILTRNVIDLRTRPDTADTAESAVAISMDELGRIDIERVAQLLGLEVDQARAAIEPLSFTDPETRNLIPAQVYLSGLVRDKLDLAVDAAAQDPEFHRNVAALQEVLPPVVPIDDISLNPGVRYVTEEMYSQFVRETFHLDAQASWNNATEAWELKLPKKRGPWDPKVLADFGTEDKKPDALLVDALNGRAPVITWVDDDGKRHKDDQATTAVREKLDKLKAEFRAWAVSVPERAQAIQDQYNRDFNSLVAPDYSALAEKMSFPGLAEGRTPYGYQRAAVARIVNEPAVLIDHVVGAGKTGTMIMSCMELRRTGITQKPAIVVPNHLVEQVGREFNQWYPGAKVLTVGSGLTVDERIRVVAQAAAGDWDAVIMPMTTFEKIQIDPLRTAAWLEEDMDKLRAEVPGADDKYEKQLQKQLKQLQTRYEKITAGKDPGVIWEQTGIDYLFVDEAHNYKNLGRTAPLQELSCAATNRASDLDYKLRAMREAKTEVAIASGRYSSSYIPAVCSFATGTPVANNMSEMWVMQHYLRPDLLHRAQVEQIGAWATAFTIQGQVIRPKPAGGGYDQVMKVKEYVNVPELVGLSAQFTDVVTTEDLSAKIPTLRSGERLLLRREPSGPVEDYVLALQDRAEALKGVRPEKGGDNMLSVVNDGRNVALDARLAGLAAEPDGGRARQLAHTIMDEHRATADKVYQDAHGNRHPVPGGLQLVFCDRAIPTSDGSFSMYHATKAELVRLGMPAETISFIHDATTDQQRSELFEKCRVGQINVLMGSTTKMGTGTNIQDRAIALHHVDLPWRPSDIEQREGRILRQGNQNESVEIYQYATDQTFDIYMNDVIAKKATFIKQLKVGQQLERSLEDPFGGLDMSASRAAAALSGDPRLEQLANLEMDVTRLKQLHAAHQTEKSRARLKLAGSKTTLDHVTAIIADLEPRITTTVRTDGDAFRFISGQGEVFTNRGQAADHVREQITAALSPAAMPGERVLGILGGHRLVFTVDQGRGDTRYHFEDSPYLRTLGRDNLGQPGSYGLMTRIENYVANMPAELAFLKKRQQFLTEEIASFDSLIHRDFDKAAELTARSEELTALKDAMGETDEKNTTDRELNREEMELLYGGLPKGALNFVARAGDRVVHQQREYRIHDLDGTLYGFTKGDEPAEENIKVKPYDELSVVGRSRELLTGHELRVLGHDREHDVVTHDRYSLQPGDRVSAELRIQGGGIRSMTGTVHTKYGGFDFQPDGHTDRISFTTTGAILRIDATTPELIAHKKAEAEALKNRVGVRDLQPGDVLCVDVPSLGAVAGDVIRLHASRFGRAEKVAVSPDTGQRRDKPPYRYGREHQDPESIDRVVGRDLEQHELAMILATTTVSLVRVREGDAVPMNQLDTSRTNPAPVRIVDVHGRGGERLDITYVDEDGDRHEVKRNADQEIEILGRRHGALTVSEVAYVATAGRGAQLKPAKNLGETDVGSYVTGSSPRTGESFHGILHQVDPDQGELVLMDDAFEISRYQVASNTAVTVCHENVPLSQLSWCQTSMQTTEPAGHQAEPERVNAEVEERTPEPKTVALLARASRVASLSSNAGQPRLPDRNGQEHHGPPLAWRPHQTGPSLDL